MRMHSKIILLILVLSSVGHFVHAQTDFSGSWTFKGQESVSGQLYSNGSPKQVSIKQDSKAIVISKVIAGKDGDLTTTETVSLDGQPTEKITASKRKRTITGQWSNSKNSLIEITQLYDPTDSTKLTYKTTDVWILENGRLLLDRKAENLGNGEIWESKATYEKQ